MFEMNYTPKRTVCNVTFQIPEDWAQLDAAIVGDFNKWDPTKNRMEKKDGNWQAVVRLKPGTNYTFKYFLDGKRWENDPEADEYIPNSFGTVDSVIITGN